MSNEIHFCNKSNHNRALAANNNYKLFQFPAILAILFMDSTEIQKKSSDLISNPPSYKVRSYSRPMCPHFDINTIIRWNWCREKKTHHMNPAADCQVRCAQYRHSDDKLGSPLGGWARTRDSDSVDCTWSEREREELCGGFTSAESSLS